jgi:hypothetical protein
MFTKSRTLIITLVALMATMISCAEERAPRSYVQPHIMSKADFTGEWYYTPTVVDLPFSSTVTFIGETAMDIAIINWDIQEKSILARLAYDRIDGSETGTHELWEGEIIGAWGISHFDIIRDYNATTGEEINVIRETAERPWYEREFIRIDWTRNLATNWAMFWPHHTKVETVGFSSIDPSDPDYPKYVRSEEGELNYIGITDKVIMAPQMRNIDWDFYGMSQIPDCFFYGTLTSCNASQIKVRHAFWKKDPDNEYEKRQYLQTEHDKFGFFLTNVLQYNRQYGVLIQNYKQYANRFNFYAQTFKKATSETFAQTYADSINHVAVDGELYQCPGGDEPCRYIDDNTKVYIMGFVAYTNTNVLSDDKSSVTCPGNEVPCFWTADGMNYIYADSNWMDDSDNAVRVTLRYAERGLRPMVYYLNPSFPDTLWGLNEAGEKNADEPAPNSALRKSIDIWAVAHNTWLDEIGVVRNDIQSVQVCPFVPADTADEDVPFAYGSNGTIKCEKDIRRGDFRKIQLNWIDEAQLSSPLGYGPPLPDPRTGESISAATNIYGEALDGYVAYQRDMVRLLTDPNFPWNDYLVGDLQASFVAFSKYGISGKDGKFVMPKSDLNWQRRGRATSKDRIKTLFSKMDTGWAAGLAKDTKLNTSAGHDVFQQSVKTRISAISQSGAFGDGTGTYLGYSRLNMLRDTPIEDRLMTSEMMLFNAGILQQAGLDPMNSDPSLLPYGSEVRAKASPLTSLNVKYIRAKERLKDIHRKNTVLYADVPFIDNGAYGIAKQLVDTHCEGTWDGSYGECGQKIYDVLREETFIGVTIHEMGHNMGLRHNFKGTYDAMNFFDPYWDIRGHDGTMGPRTSDPITQYEIENRLTDYAYTSIMDYNGNWNGDFMGLGKYDVAAIAYAYGGLRQVFDTTMNNAGIATMQTFSEYSYPAPLSLGNDRATSVHYTAFPTYADLSDDNRSWVPNAWITKEGDTYKTVATLDGGTSRYMVPFMHCSDEFRNLALGCNLFDQGADIYEITQFVTDMYERNYVRNNWSHGSYTWGWDTDKYQGRIVSRYFDLLQNHVQYYMLWLGIFYDNFDQYYGQAGIEEFFTDDVEGWGSWTLAVSDIFSTFIRTLTMPSPGWHQEMTGPNDETFFKYNTDEDQYCSGTGPGTDCEFKVPLIVGKYIDDSYDYDYGYEWYMKIERRGQFFDRPLAIQMIAEATNNWLGRDTQEDFRKYTMNFARLFPAQIMSVFKAIQTNDMEKIATAVCVDGNGDTQYEHTYAADLRGDDSGSTTGVLPCQSTEMIEKFGPLTFSGYMDPNNTFSIQLYAATLGMALFPMNYSQSFIDVSRIYVKGNGEGIDWDNVPITDIETFVDPFSMKEFISLKYNQKTSGGITLDVSIGAKMLDYANQLLVKYEDAASAYTAAGGTVETAELEYNELNIRKRNLVNYIDNIEMVRGLTRQLEFADFQAP